MKSNLSHFSFIYWVCFCYCSKKSLLEPKKFLGAVDLFIIWIVYTDVYEVTDFLLFLSRSFTVLGFTCTSTMHMEWIFVHSMDEVQIEVWGVVVDAVVFFVVVVALHEYPLVLVSFHWKRPKIGVMTCHMCTTTWKKFSMPFLMVSSNREKYISE